MVIPTIPGREDLLDRALSSVRGQLACDPDIVVVCDVDRDGAATTRNRGLARVTTPWVAWLDDDDELLPWHLTSLLAACESSGADLAYSYAEFIGSDDPLATSLDGRLVKPLGVPFGSEQLRHLRERGNFIPVTYLVRTDPVRAVGGFPQPNSFPARASQDCEDYGLLLRLLDAGVTFRHEPVISWRYYFHGHNTGGRGDA